MLHLLLRWCYITFNLLHSEKEKHPIHYDMLEPATVAREKTSAGSLCNTCHKRLSVYNETTSGFYLYKKSLPLYLYELCEFENIAGTLSDIINLKNLYRMFFFIQRKNTVIFTSPAGAVKHCDEHVYLPGYLQNHTAIFSNFSERVAHGRGVHYRHSRVPAHGHCPVLRQGDKIPRGRPWRGSLGGFLPHWQCMVTCSLENDYSIADN